MVLRALWLCSSVSACNSESLAQGYAPCASTLAPSRGLHPQKCATASHNSGAGGLRCALGRRHRDELRTSTSWGGVSSPGMSRALSGE